MLHPYKLSWKPATAGGGAEQRKQADMTLQCSKKNDAEPEKIFLCRATISRNLGFKPSAANSRFTLSVVMEFGRPPQGTKRSAVA